MTVPTFIPPVSPSPGTQDKPEIKLLSAEFGDGYSQPVRDGINHIRTVLTLRWDLLERDEKDEIVAFLTERGGDRPFLYALPGQPAKRHTCADWTVTSLAAEMFNVTATLRQDFGLPT